MPDTRPRLFVSYSRSDSGFVDLLIPRLEAAGFDISIDRSSIRKGEDWWRRIVDLVVDATLVIFVISPESVSSAICRQELELAQKKALKKRVLPVLFRPVTGDLPPDLAKRDWVSFEDAGRRYGEVLAAWTARLAASGDVAVFEREDARFQTATTAFQEAASASVDAQMGTLLQAITLEDVHWHDEGAKWLQRTKAWDDAHCVQGLLLASGELELAQAWIERRPPSAEIPELVHKFVRISRKQAELDAETLRVITGRAFALPAEEARVSGSYESAIRAVAAGALLAKDTEMEAVPELKRTLYLSVPRRRLVKGCGGEDLHAGILSPDGAFVATTHRKAQVKIWETRSDRCVATMQWRFEGIYEPGIIAIDVSWHRRILVASSSQGGVQAWRFGEETPFFDLGRTEVMEALSFFASGDHVLASGRSRKLSIISIAEARMWPLAHESYAGRAVMSPSGARALLDAHPTQLWDLSAPEAPVLIAKVEGYGINRPSMDDQDFCHTEQDGVSLRSLETGEITASFEIDERESIVLAKAHVLAIGKKKADLYTRADRRLLRSFSSPDGAPIRSAALRGDGACVAIGTNWGSLQLYDAATGALIYRVNDLGEQVYELLFAADGSLLASQGYSEHGPSSGLCLWDARLSDYPQRVIASEAETSVEPFATPGDVLVANQTALKLVRAREEPLTLPHSADTSHAASSHDGAQLVAWRKGGELLWWTAPFVDAPRALPAERPYGAPKFDLGNRRLAVINGKRVLVFDVASRTLKTVLEGHQKDVRAVSFSDDGIWIATCADDLMIRVWESDTAQPVASVKSGHEPKRAFFGGGRDFLLTTDGRNHWAYSLPNGTPIHRGLSNRHLPVAAVGPVAPHIVIPHWEVLGVFTLGAREPFAKIGREGEKISDVKFSRDGRTLLTVHPGILRLWDAQTGLELANTFSSEEPHFIGAGFAPGDDDTIVCELPDEVRLWDVRLARQLDRVPRVTLAAAIGWEAGYMNRIEQKHLVLQMAPENLGRAVAELLSEDEKRRAAALAGALLQKRSAGCYTGATLRV